MSYIENLMKWFSCEQELKDWAGPNFRYPYDLASFSADLNLDSLNTSSLFDEKSDLLAYWSILLAVK